MNSFCFPHKTDIRAAEANRRFVRLADLNASESAVLVAPHSRKSASSPFYRMLRPTRMAAVVTPRSVNAYSVLQFCPSDRCRKALLTSLLRAFRWVRLYVPVMNVFDLPFIPITDDRGDTRGYHAVRVDTGDPRGQERLVDVIEHGIAAVPYYHIADGSNAPYERRIEGSMSRVLCRSGLVPMLHRANELLADQGCELVVYDAYRPIETQKGLWSWALSKFTRENPDLANAEVVELTSQYSSDPRRFDPADSSTWPTHSTGGSVDVMLQSLGDGAVLDLGAAFDDLGPVAHTDHLERSVICGEIEPNTSALLNRRLLYYAMTQAGFVNYPAEFWHYDFGNQMYAFNSDEAAPAWYGYAAAP